MSKLKAFQKFSSTDASQHGNSKEHLLPAQNAIRSLEPGEAVPIPVHPIWQDIAKARLYVSVTARRYFGKAVTIRTSDCKKFIIVYRKTA